MTSLTPAEVARRERIETLLRLAAPALDLVLACGERLSRLVEPNDFEYYPIGNRDDDADLERRTD